jgi:hypothetical protein
MFPLQQNFNIIHKKSTKTQYKLPQSVKFVCFLNNTNKTKFKKKVVLLDKWSKQIANPE